MHPSDKNCLKKWKLSLGKPYLKCNQIFFLFGSCPIGLHGGGGVYYLLCSRPQEGYRETYESKCHVWDNVQIIGLRGWQRHPIFIASNNELKTNFFEKQILYGIRKPSLIGLLLLTFYWFTWKRRGLRPILQQATRGRLRKKDRVKRHWWPIRGASSPDSTRARTPKPSWRTNQSVMFGTMSRSFASAWTVDCKKSWTTHLRFLPLWKRKTIMFNLAPITSFGARVCAVVIVRWSSGIKVPPKLPQIASQAHNHKTIPCFYSIK